MLEIEAAAPPPLILERVPFVFNETAGSMVKICLAAAVIRALQAKNCIYDLHINVIGGGRIDGPSAGLAMVIVLLSAIKNYPFSTGGSDG